MTRSRAAVFDGTPGRLRIRQFEVPSPVPGEVVVEVVACTLCGSDLHSFDGRRQVPVPTILGHEIVGQVARWGGTHAPLDQFGHPLAVGDLITWSIVAACGECFYCQRDLPQKCLHAVKYGHESLRPGGELRGGLAEHCLLAPGTALVKLPTSLPLAVACPASCATATIAAALERAGDLSGQSVCVLGAGLLGLTACAMARTSGAANVVCVDNNPRRRQRSAEFGATHCVAPDELQETVRVATQGFGVDLILELTGAPAALLDAWPCARLGARIGLVGAVFPSDPIPLSMEQVIRRHLTVYGIHNYAPRHLAQAVAFLERQHHAYPFQSLVSHWLPLEDVESAFELARGSEAVRVGITPSSGPLHTP